ncbi:MarR family winged helix-turn-helix transcriptional regulator [Leifsonia xyli]|uniref:MarR family winged helix-turn-helix transcriptional regulator n=1 Tax=Leifsonia xyli TaxID=1575 RepID=UPI003D66702D
MNPSSTTFFYLVKQVELGVRAHLEAVVGDEGITALQYTALTVLERHPGMSAADLARFSFVRPQTMAQMITVLEERELLVKERSSDDKRRFGMYLTAAGRNTLERLRLPVARLEERMTSDLDSAQQNDLLHALAAVRARLEAEGAPARIADRDASLPAPE